MAIGGARKGAGRKAGVPNKQTADVKALAQKHCEDAIKALAKIAKGGKSIPVAAQVAACKELLDRGFGKSVQPISGADDAPPVRLGLLVEYVGEAKTPRTS